MSACPRPDIKRHLATDRTTRGARLGTRVPAVALDERFADARRLVLDESCQHTPPCVSRRFREAVVRHNTLHIQVFDGDHLVFVYDPSGQLVKVVTSSASNPLMDAGYQSPGFVPAVRSFLLT